MKKFHFVKLLFTFVILSFIIIPFGATSYAKIPDGTYEIQYEIKHAKKEDTSIADGYFTKPATLTVKNGVQEIQITITSAHLVQKLSTPSGPVQVLNETKDGDSLTRVVKFRVDGDLTKPVLLDMHIIVPPMDNFQGYDMEHSARAVFDVAHLVVEEEEDKPKSEPAKKPDKKEEDKGAQSGSGQNKSEVEDQSNEETTSNDEETTNEVGENETDTNEENESDEDTNNAENEANEENEAVEEADDKEESAKEETAATDTKKSDKEKGNSSLVWIPVTIVILAVIGGISVWIYRQN